MKIISIEKVKEELFLIEYATLFGSKKRYVIPVKKMVPEEISSEILPFIFMDDGEYFHYDKQLKWMIRNKLSSFLIGVDSGIQLEDDHINVDKMS